jgi:PIN domain nuclease of toxin-antitoxin system
MRLLLDTATFLWLDTKDARLSLAALEALRTPENEIFLSSISVTEISIKSELGKLDLPDDPRIYLPSRRESYRIKPLPWTEDTALLLASLPRHHRDPFDRMLVCQALHHRLTLVTSDSAIARYQAPILW